MKELRRLVLNSGLTEDFKWRQPCYTLNGANVCIVSSFKDCAFISFFKGALLSDPEELLSRAGEHTQAARLIRFTEHQQILDLEKEIAALIQQALEIEKAGLKVENTNPPELVYPDELQELFSQQTHFQDAFEQLSPGRQRAYLMFFSAAKQSQTRLNRILKYQDRILDGKGINDCVCGHSKKMPGCDGSHKFFP